MSLIVEVQFVFKVLQFVVQCPMSDIMLAIVIAFVSGVRTEYIAEIILHTDIDMFWFGPKQSWSVTHS